MTKETIAVMQDEAIHCVEVRQPVSWVSADLVVWCAVPYGKTKWLRAKIFTAVTEAFRRVTEQMAPMLEVFSEVHGPMHGIAATLRDVSARRMMVARTLVTTRDAVIAAVRSSTGLAYLDPAVLSEVKRAHKHKATVHEIVKAYLAASPVPSPHPTPAAQPSFLLPGPRPEEEL